jgi:hypothetical protein
MTTTRDNAFANMEAENILNTPQEWAAAASDYLESETRHQKPSTNKEEIRRAYKAPASPFLLSYSSTYY